MPSFYEPPNMTGAAQTHSNPTVRSSQQLPPEAAPIDPFAGAGGGAGGGSNANDPFSYTMGSLLTPWTKTFQAPASSGGGSPYPTMPEFNFGSFNPSGASAMTFSGAAPFAWNQKNFQGSRVKAPSGFQAPQTGFMGSLGGSTPQPAPTSMEFGGSAPNVNTYVLGADQFAGTPLAGTGGVRGAQPTRQPPQSAPPQAPVRPEATSPDPFQGNGVWTGDAWVPKDHPAAQAVRTKQAAEDAQYNQAMQAYEAETAAGQPEMVLEPLSEWQPGPGRQPPEVPNDQLLTKATDQFSGDRLQQSEPFKGGSFDGGQVYNPLRMADMGTFQGGPALAVDRFNVGPGFQPTERYEAMRYTPDADFTGGDSVAFTPDRYTEERLADRPEFDAPSYEEMMADPAYQFRIKQAQQMMENSASAKGMLHNPNTVRALQDYSQEAASQEYDKIYSRRRGEHELATSDAQSTYAANQAERMGGFDRNYQAARDESTLGFDRAAGIYDRNTASDLATYDRNAAANRDENMTAYDRATGEYDRDFSNRLTAYDRNTQADILENTTAYDRAASERDRTVGEQTSLYDRNAAAARDESLINYDRRASEFDRTYNNASSEYDRTFANNRAVNETNYGRGASEFDRNYSNAANADQRAYERAANEYDRDFSQNMAVDQTNYDRGSSEYDRNFSNAFDVYQGNYANDLNAFGANSQASQAAQALNWQVQSGSYDRNYQDALMRYNMASEAAMGAYNASNASSGQSYNQALNQYEMERDQFWKQQEIQYGRIRDQQMLGYGAAGGQANSNQGYAGTMGDLYAGYGNSQASGTMGSANAWTQAAQGAGNAAMGAAAYYATRPSTPRTLPPTINGLPTVGYLPGVNPSGGG